MMLRMVVNQNTGLAGLLGSWSCYRNDRLEAARGRRVGLTRRGASRGGDVERSPFVTRHRHSSVTPRCWAVRCLEQTCMLPALSTCKQCIIAQLTLSMQYCMRLLLGAANAAEYAVHEATLAYKRG